MCSSDADTRVWLWDPTGTGLAKVYRTSDPLARVVPSKPNLVLGHRETDYSPQEETVEPGGCLDLIDVDTLAVRGVTCGDDSTRASRTPYPTAVSPDGAIVMASMPMTLDGDRIDRQGEPATSMAYFGVFPQQRFSDGDHLIKPVGNPRMVAVVGALRCPRRGLRAGAATAPAYGRSHCIDVRADNSAGASQGRLSVVSPTVVSQAILMRRMWGSMSMDLRDVEVLRTDPDRPPVAVVEHDVITGRQKVTFGVIGLWARWPGR